MIADQPAPAYPLPEFLVCDPTPSQEEEIAATFVLRLSFPRSLWRFGDEDKTWGEPVHFFESQKELERLTPQAPQEKAQFFARVAREVGDFWATHCQEIDEA